MAFNRLGSKRGGRSGIGYPADLARKRGDQAFEFMPLLACCQQCQAQLSPRNVTWAGLSEGLAPARRSPTQLTTRRWPVKDWTNAQNLRQIQRVFRNDGRNYGNQESRSPKMPTNMQPSQQDHVVL